jgi:hypothetical protein
LAGVFALFGVIHSPLRNEQIDLPRRVLEQIPESFREAIRYQTPYHWTGAYALVVLLLLLLALMSGNSRERTKNAQQSTQEDRITRLE